MLTNKFFIVALILPLLLAPPFAQGQENNRNQLPEIGASGFSSLSIEKERQIGNIMMRQLRASQPLINDPVLMEYINDLGNRLVRNADDVNYSFEFFLINNKELNAFAFFGGHVGIHGGLVTAADTESELASVIAHEISHVTQRHLARRMAAQSRTQPLSMAGLITGVLLTLVNPTVGMAALSTSIAASTQMGINYTRGNEKEADRVGIALLANSGFNPMGAPNFFAKMAEKYRYQSKPPAMLLTHPLPESRISDARLRAQNLPSRPDTPSLAFELTKARLTARYEGNPRDNIKKYQRILTKNQYVIREAAMYGLAISYYENKNFQQAVDILQILQRKDKNNLFYADVLTDCYIALKNFDGAIKMMAELNLLMPNNQVVALNYANVLAEAKQYRQAELILQDFIILNQNHYIANDLLMTIYRKQDKFALMHATKAEVYALLGAYRKAIDELQTGYNFVEDNPLEKKRIRARILQFQSQQDKLQRLN